METNPDVTASLSTNGTDEKKDQGAANPESSHAGVNPTHRVAERVSASAENWRRKLLDLSRRNRLLNFKPTKVSTVTVVDEQPAEVFRHLVISELSMKFRAVDDQLNSTADEELTGSEGIPIVESPFDEQDRSVHLDFVPYDRAALDHRHVDDVLQTTFDPESLDKSLRRIDEQARSTLEEQGVNTLFLALGILEYSESRDSNEMWRAPLVLVPVELNRKSARTGFSLSATDDDSIVNPALIEYLRGDFGISLPSLPDSSSLSDTYDLQEFLNQVSTAVSSQRGWAVKTGIYLGLFSFQKFVMYKDLEANRSALETHRLIRQLITRSGTSFGTLPPEIRSMELDEEYPPEKTFQVVDADSSQLRAIAAVSRGHDLVLEGPPGTGKSQTITNLIAHALATGQSVLFVAEKMAALDVVHRRLVEAGLGDFCLEVHSTKANKRTVMAALAAGLDASLTQVATPTASTQRIPAVRFALSDYVKALHTRAYALATTPYAAYGELGAVYWAPKLSWSGTPEEVTREQLDETDRELRDLSVVAVPLGRIDEHPFFGSQKTFYTESDIDAIKGAAAAGLQDLDKLRTLSKSASENFGVPDLSVLADVRETVVLRNLLAASPGAPVDVLLNPAWNAAPPAATQLVQEGRELSRQIARTEQLFTKDVFDQEHADDIAFIVDKASGFFGFLAVLNGRFRTIKNRWVSYRRAFVGNVLEQANELRRVDAIQSKRAQLSSRQDEAAKLFGQLWKGEKTDWASVDHYITWVTNYRAAALRYHLPDAAAKFASDSRPDVSEIDAVIASADDVKRRITQLEELVGWTSSFVSGLELSAILSKLDRLEQGAELAPQWASFENAREKVDRGLAHDLLDPAMRGELDFGQLASSFRRAFFQSWLNRVVGERPPLRDFHTLTHEQRVAEFRELDERVLRENRAALIAKLRDQIQHRLQQPDSVACMPFLQREMTKQRGIAPLRTTMKHAEAAVRAIKPCFMMSPLTVAQLLPGDVPTFDLVVFDEASQLPPEDAVGAIIRGNRLVVVGDPKQLPPTNFFSVLSSGEEGPIGDDGLPLYTDAESVLEEFTGAGLPTSRLKWHYRSAHESLINFSNISFYDSDLYTFPSVEINSATSGVKFEHVDGATYEGKGLNQVEARRVADAVLSFAREQLEQRVYGNETLSLGVGTFNLRQQLAIQDELEQRRRDDPTIEEFFDRGAPEPFFVKNLENIQGDERDVIFISVTYAKGQDGRLRYNFGPLNSQNGWRRLNVLITRARRMMRVFSSMHGDEIGPATTGSDGPRLLREFLIYAEHGRMDSTHASKLADTESPFERDVLQQLTRAGVTAFPQVGFAGYRIDLGVVDDARPGKFLCGIECDGVAYHESETARDRDRLRQQVLEDRGWTIHRVWSTDWFKDRPSQIRRLLALIEADKVRAKEEVEADRVARDVADESGAVANDGLDLAVEGGSQGSIGAPAYRRPTAQRYVVTPHDGSRDGFDLLSAPESEVAGAIALVVATESPIHAKDLHGRVAAMWGTRAGRRIVDRIAISCRSLERSGTIARRGAFYWRPGSTAAPRLRTGTGIPAERIAPEEYEETVLLILKQGHGFSRTELLTEARATLGFGRLNDELKTAVNQAIAELLKRGLIGEGSTGFRLRKLE